MEEQLRGDLRIAIRNWTDHQDAQCNSEGVEGLYVRDYREDGVPDQAPRTRRDARFVYGEIEPCLSGHWDSRSLEIHPANKIREHAHFSKTRSKVVINAQAFGAQYAWFNPRVNGKRRESSCGSWPISANGPMESRKTRITAFASVRNRTGRITPDGDIQYARRRYTK